jgi:hypothetical protein
VTLVREQHCRVLVARISHAVVLRQLPTNPTEKNIFDVGAATQKTQTIVISSRRTWTRAILAQPVHKFQEQT